MYNTPTTKGDKRGIGNDLKKNLKNNSEKLES